MATPSPDTSLEFYGGEYGAIVPYIGICKAEAVKKHFYKDDF